MYNYIVIIIIIIITINLITRYYNKENFDNNNKIVYIVWNDKINKQGLGDKLRGTIAIYQYCRLNNIKCIFDATLSEFNKYLKNSNSYNPDLNINTPITSLLNIYDDDQAIKNLIDKELKSKNQAYVFCNLFPVVPLEFEDLQFLNYITEPIDELKEKINNLLKILPKNFTIQHFRFIDNNDPSNDKCNLCYQLLKKNYKKTDILMSNSNLFKKFILNKININIINSDNCHELHIGNNPISSVIEFTLLEYFILIKSTSIITYNEYSWISAFVYWPSKFYNIEIENYYI